MGRGPKKHLKRVAAPSAWMLHKMGGTFAPRPNPGPHKLRECLPLILILRNKLRYAYDRRETMLIVNGGQVKVDGKVRRDVCYPVGIGDVVTIDATGEAFRLLYDTKGRFTLVKLKDAKEATFKVCKIRRAQLGPKGVPYIALHDARTIRYPLPEARVGDSVKVDIASGKVSEHLPFVIGASCMITGGRNAGRVGVYTHRDAHPGGFEIITLTDARGHSFATRSSNVMVIGKGKTPLISLPKEKGIAKSILEEREERLKKNN